MFPELNFVILQMYVQVPEHDLRSCYYCSIHTALLESSTTISSFDK